MTTDATLRILLVEDSEDDALLIDWALQRSGLRATTERVASAEALHAALDRGGWDVVLSDYSLPSFSGRVALDIVRQRTQLDLPFIVVSGTLGEHTAVEMMKAGAHDFFPKGDLARLPAVIEREVRDATARRQRRLQQERAEAERQQLLGDLRDAVRARDTFLTLAAHELRSPLTAVQLKVDALRRSDRRAATVPPDRLESSLAFLAWQHRRLGALVDNFVAFAAITGGDQTLRREDVDLAHEASAARRFFDEDIHASGSSASLQAAAPVVGRWDRSAIRTVVKNLLSNAVKYGGGKPIEIGVEAQGGRATLTVADHGVGISGEEKARIFNKFEHVVPTHHHTGFGLGLWIVRSIVEAHGGTIDVQSGAGEGSTFTVELPLDAPDPHASS